MAIILSKNLLSYLIFLLFLNQFLSIPYIEIPLKKISLKNDLKSNDDSYLKLSTVESKLVNNSDNLFVANIKIGSDSQNFNLLLDIELNILWVKSNEYIDYSDNIENYYNPSTSTTSQRIPSYYFLKNYRSSIIGGLYYSDSINFSGKFFNLNFGVANLTFQYDKNADGVIGLGRKFNNYDESFIHSFCNSNNIDSKSFSIKKNKFYIGKHENFDKNDILSCELQETESWSCKLQSMRIKSQKHEFKSFGDFNIKFDTVSEFIIMPLTYLSNFLFKLSKFECEDFANHGFFFTNYHQLRCKQSKNLPEFYFQIGNSEFRLPTDVIYYKYGGFLYSRILFKENDEIVMGAPFFNVYHTLFDYEGTEMKFYYVGDEEDKEEEKVEEKEEEKEEEREKEAEKEDEKEKEEEKEKEAEKEEEKEEEKEAEKEKEKEAEKEEEKEKEKEKEKEEEKEAEKEKEKETEKEEEMLEKEKEKDTVKKDDSNGLSYLMIGIGSLLIVAVIVSVIICIRCRKNKELDDVGPIEDPNTDELVGSEH